MLHRVSFAALILVPFTALPARSVEVQPGQLYAAGTRVESGETGVALTIPAGWQGAWPQDSEFFVLEPVAGGATVLVYIESLNQPALLQTLSQPISMDFFTLRPTLAPAQKESFWVADYAVAPPVNGLAKGHVAARTDGSTAVAFIGLSRADDAKVAPVADDLARTATILTPKPALPGGLAASGAGSWDAYLMGRYIARYYTGSGYTEESHLWLCSDRSFSFSGSSGGFGGGASGASQGGGSGTWKATGMHAGPGHLVLSYSSGQSVTYGLAVESGKLYLDGTQWLRDGNDRCP